MNLHFEGLDLAGKSTLCRHVLRALPHAAYFHNALTAHNKLHEIADRIRLRDEMEDAALGELYYGALLADLRHYTPREGGSVQDSTILLRSLVYHRIQGNEELARRFEDLLGEHPRFDHTFVLTAPRDVRLRRLAGRISRGNDAPEDYVVRDDPERFSAMEQLLTETAVQHFDAEIIDTGMMEDDRERDRLVAEVIQRAQSRMA